MRKSWPNKVLKPWWKLCVDLPLHSSLVVQPAILVLASTLAWAESPRPPATKHSPTNPSAIELVDTNAGIPTETLSPNEPTGCRRCLGERRERCRPDVSDSGGFYGGAEFLLLRPHFSEAIAFARVTDSIVGSTFVRQTRGIDLEFDYEGSPRAFVGYRLGDRAGEFQFSYWHFQGDTSAGESIQMAGVTLVDPFGNEADDLADEIRTHARVETNVYDLHFAKSALGEDSRWALKWLAGVRIADVNQFYNATIRSDSGTLLSIGEFSADFLGAGPRLGVEALRKFGQEGRFELFAKGSGALLVGEYDVHAGSTIPASIPPIEGTQKSSLTRTVPVAEIELGASWRVCQPLTISTGWLFQGWFDLGASGGRFGDLFLGADDSNIMSFDGLFLRAELAF
ncbi:MAG: hypothetical protein HY000_38945 [Planctomycetes bacterium]|nr:hypothetical protein [Planctomycetota bacterium]